MTSDSSEDEYTVSSAGYHITFGFFFFFSSIFITYYRYKSNSSFPRTSTIKNLILMLDGPFIIAITMSIYQMLSCFILGGSSTYFSSYSLRPSAYYWSTIPPLHLMLRLSQFLIVALYRTFHHK